MARKEASKEEKIEEEPVVSADDVDDLFDDLTSTSD